MGGGGAVSKVPSDPRSGLTCIVRLWESTFALRAINEQTFLNLRTTEHASENVKVARHLRRRRSTEFAAEEKKTMDNTIWQAHTAVWTLSKLLEPARVDRVDMYGDEKISLSTKGLWVLNDSPEVTAAFDQVQVAHEALDEVIGSLQSPRKLDIVPPTQPILPSTKSTEYISRTPYDASQLLAWRRQSRMNLRRDTIPPTTEGLGVQGVSGIEFAVVPPESHSIKSASKEARAGPRPNITLSSQQQDESQDAHDTSAPNYLSGSSEAIYRIPPKSPSRVSLQTQNPSPPQSDTGSSPRVQKYPASPPPQNSYHSPPSSSRGNSPPSQHQVSPQPRSRALLQDQSQTSLQTERQNVVRDQQKAWVGPQNQFAATKHFEVISEIDYPPQLPRGYVPRDNSTDLPPERHYHLPRSFLTRTRSKYRDNAARGDHTSEILHEDPQTSQTQPNQGLSQTEEESHQQQRQAFPYLRFQDQQDQKPPVPPSPQTQLPYHNPGPFFLGQRERDRPQLHGRTSSDPTTYPPSANSRHGYRLPMVFEENLYGGLEVVVRPPPDHVTTTEMPADHGSSLPPGSSQLNQQPHQAAAAIAYRGLAEAPPPPPPFADAELESVSTHSHSQHDLAKTTTNTRSAPSSQEDEVAYPSHWTQAAAAPPLQEPVPNIHPKSPRRYDIGNSYSELQHQQQQPAAAAAVVTHSQSHYDLGNPYWPTQPHQPQEHSHQPQYDTRNPYSSQTTTQQDPTAAAAASSSSVPSDPQYSNEIIKHTQSLNEANNPYSRANKRSSWLVWQASRSVTARGLNDRYSL